MIQIAVILVAIGLVILGIKGFTRGGIPISGDTRLTGTSGQIVGTILILAGLAFVPAFFIAFAMFAESLR